jgi:YVTN family beta-propeller protein
MPTKLYYLVILAAFFFFACLPDRMAPEPVEIGRPDFIAFAEDDSAGINIPLDDPVVMIFDEKMDVQTFPDNFSLQSISGSINGSFSLSASDDNVVIFTPGQSMNPAERYEVSLSGRIRDANGNAMNSPIEEEVFITTWFFTTGEYAVNGFPYVFVTDKVDGSIIYRIHEIDYLKDQENILDQSSEMRLTPDGSKLIVTNKLIDGTITIVNPANLEEIAKIPVGQGPDHIYVTNEMAFVSNVQEQTIALVDLSSLTVAGTISFTDGFRPRDVVYCTKTNKIYVSSNTTSDFARLRVIDVDNPENFYDVENIMPQKRTKDMEISQDGEYIFLAELQTTNLIIFSTGSETVVSVLEAEFIKNEDGAISTDAYYLVTNGGGVFKVDLTTISIVDQLELGKTATAIAATAAGELLYVVTPTDSSLQIVETSTMTRITEIKVPAALKNVAISNVNYE